jgi:hypothetical protein
MGPPVAFDNVALSRSSHILSTSPRGPARFCSCLRRHSLPPGVHPAPEPGFPVLLKKVLLPPSKQVHKCCDGREMRIRLRRSILLTECALVHAAPE